MMEYDLTDLDGDITPIDDLNDTISSIQKITEFLNNNGCTIKSSFAISKLITLAQELLSLANSSLHKIKTNLDVDDFADVFQQAIDIAEQTIKITSLLNSTSQYFDHLTEKHIKSQHPLQYSELHQVYLKDLEKVNKKFREAYSEIFLIGFLRFCNEFNIDAGLYVKILKDKYPHILSKINLLLVLCGWTTNDLVTTTRLSQLNGINLRQNRLKPPPESVASRLIYLSQGMIPQCPIIHGCCFGDAMSVLFNPVAVLQGYTAESRNRQLQSMQDFSTVARSDVYAFKTCKNSFPYAIWAKYILNTVRAIFASELENNDRVSLCLYPESEGNGHAVSFVKMSSNGTDKYYYRDLNLGVFEIKDFSKFTVWFGMQLQINQWVEVHYSVLLPENMLKSVDYVANNSSDSNKLKYLALNVSGDFKFEDIMSIDCSTLGNELDKKLYCIGAVISLFSSIDNKDFYVLRTRILNTLARCNNDEPDYIIIRAMLTFCTAYHYWWSNKLPQAKQYFKEYNNINCGFSKVQFSSKDTFNFKNVWLVRDEFTTPTGLKWIGLLRSARASLMREAFNAAAAATYSPYTALSNALLFRRMANKIDEEQQLTLAARSINRPAC